MLFCKLFHGNIIFLIVLSIISITSTVLSTMSTAAGEAEGVYDMLEKCDTAPDPVPALTVTGYETDPEVFMTGDVGVLRITLENAQDSPVDKKINMLEESHNDYKFDIETTTTYSMNALISEAYIVERDFKVYNRYSAAEVVGPGKETELAFKIKAPAREGIYMLKFIGKVECADNRGCGRDIRYWVPVVVCGDPLKILAKQISPEVIEVEVVNRGICDVSSVFVEVVSEENIEIADHNKTVYIGDIPAGKAEKAHFYADIKGTGMICFKATFKNGLNNHETENLCVTTTASNSPSSDMNPNIATDRNPTDAVDGITGITIDDILTAIINLIRALS